MDAEGGRECVEAESVDAEGGRECVEAEGLYIERERGRQRECI